MTYLPDITDRPDRELGVVALDAATLAALETVAVTDGGGTLTVDGTVALDAATLAALESITVVDGGGSLTVDGTVALDAASLAALESVSLASALPAGTNNIGKVTRSIDSGRTAVSINYNATNPPTADALLATLVLNKGAVNSTGQTSIAVTAGKVLRLTHVVVSTRATVATLPYGLLTLRVNHAGAAVLASPAFLQVPVSGNAAVIGNTGVTSASIEDGLELSGTMQLALSFSGNLASNVVAVSVLGYEYTP